MNKAVILVPIAVISLGFVFFVCSQPVFSYIVEVVETLPPVQKSETIMDYSISVDNYWSDKQIPFQCTSDQTLSISITSNKHIDFAIKSQASVGVVATYLSYPNTTSVQTSWKPNVGGSYYLSFYPSSFDYVYVGNPANVYGNVVKHWSETATQTNTVLRYKSLIDRGFEYIGLGLISVGIFVLVFCISIIRQKTRE